MPFLGTGVQAQRLLGFGMHVGSGMKWWQTGFCGYPGVMLALASSGLLWLATAGGLVISRSPLGTIGRSDGRFDRWFLPIGIGIAFAIDYWDCA